VAAFGEVSAKADKPEQEARSAKMVFWGSRKCICPFDRRIDSVPQKWFDRNPEIRMRFQEFFVGFGINGRWTAAPTEPLHRQSRRIPCQLPPEDLLPTERQRDHEIVYVKAGLLKVVGRMPGAVVI
jgi:hypothetical protein